MIGRTISHYKILSLLGEGGMGSVYKAEDTKLNRTVAIKFLPDELNRDEEAKNRFIHEAKAASSLEHNNICNIHEIDQTDDGKLFIVMSCYEGESLRDKINKGPLKIDEAISIVIGAASGLKKAHEKNIIHRDIKPANIFITEDGVVKILDFGLAKAAGRTKLTQKGSTLGTINYMSPEQTRGENVDLRSDIWSLGVVFYEMLTGQVPFKGDYEQAAIYSILNEDPKGVTELRSGIPMELEKIILKCLNKNPQNRYQHLDDLIVDIKLLPESPKTKSDIRTQNKINKNWIRSGIIIAAVLLLTIAILLTVIPFNENRTEDIRLIVLPLENLGGQENNYFAEGLTEELIGRLSFINGLAVIPRNQSMQLLHENKPISEIRREIDVDYVLSGSVSWDRSNLSDKIRISINLIDAEKEKQIWTEKYEAEISDIFAIQTDIAERLAKKLDIEILVPAREKIAAVPTGNMEAYNLHLKISPLIREAQKNPDTKEQVEEYLKIEELFIRMVELDSTYYSGITNYLHFSTFLYNFGFDKTEKRRLTAEKLLDRLVEIMPDNPNTRLQQALFYYRIYKDYHTAYKILKEIAKEYPSFGRFWLASTERRLGMWNESINHLKELADYDASGDFFQNLGSSYMYTRQYDLADHEFNRSLVKQPGSFMAIEDKAMNRILWTGDLNGAKKILTELPEGGKNSLMMLLIHRLEREYYSIFKILDRMPHQIVDRQEEYFVKYIEYAQCYYLSNLIEQQKIYADSARIFLESQKIEKAGDPAFYAALGLAYAFLEKSREAELNILKAVELLPLEKDALTGPIYLFYQAKILAIIGKPDQAVDKLKLLSSIPSRLSKKYIALDPIWDPLRNNPEFISLIK